MPIGLLHGILVSMAYEITATRKRPQSFEDLAGQEFVSATLRASIASGRIAHAYLFAGPRGCGKTSTARILARSLNCEGGPTAEPCGTCDSCTSIARGAALDVIEIDGASNTSVENIRQIKDEVLFPPNSSKYKIYIIDEVHMLSNSAFNALLKTIEEPPPYIVFMFATTELHKVPATIKSRCQQFNFRLIPLEAIQKCLVSAAADLQVRVDPEAILWIAREATGSLRDAYTLFDQVASFSEGHISAAKIRDKLGLVGTERMGSLMELCVQGDRGGALSMLDTILDSGVSVEQFSADAVTYARALLLLSCGIEREALLGAPRSSFSAAVTSLIDAPRVERMLAGLFDLYRNMRYSINPRFELELAVARLCAIKDYVPPAELSRTISGLKTAIAGGKTPAASPIASSFMQAIAAGQGGEPIAAVQKKINIDANAQPAEPKTDQAIHRHQKALAAAPDAGDSLITDGILEAIIDMDVLKRNLVTALGKKLVLSSSLERSTKWTINGDRLEILCANSYDANTVLTDANIVTRKATELAGRTLRIEPRAPESIQAQAAGPKSDDDDDSDDGDDGPADPVEIVERVFRGKRVSEKSTNSAPGGQ